MFWKQSISVITGVTLLLITFSVSIAFSDTIVAEEKVVTGRVASMDANGVNYYHHCTVTGKLQFLSWDELDGFRFDDDCEKLISTPHFDSRSTFIPSAPDTPPELTRVFKIKCRNGEEFYAKFIFLGGDIFRATSFKDDLTITCNEENLRKMVKTISTTYRATDKIPKSGSIPTGFEPVQLNKP